MPPRIIKLQSGEGDTFEVDVEAAKGSDLVKGMLSTNRRGKKCGGKKRKSLLPVIPLPKVRTHTLEKVIEWLDYHKNGRLSDEVEGEEVVHDPRAPELNTWENNFLDGDHVHLSRLIIAAHALQINNLFDACGKKIASIIVTKSPEEIRELFNLEDDLAPDEKQMIQYENDLCLLYRR